MKLVHTRSSILITALACVHLGACASTPKMAVAALDPLPELRGPRRTITVGDFTAGSAFMEQYGNWDIGGGLAAMLTTELSGCDHFVVVERARLQAVLTEQELGGQGLLRPESAPAIGELLGAQLMVYGHVTEFSLDESGGGFGLGIASDSFGGLLSGALSRKSSQGTVGIDLRIVDTTTGEVIVSKSVRSVMESKGSGFTLGFDAIKFGSEEFEKTPIGLAAREAIQAGVHVVAHAANGVEWSARVADVKGEELVLNVGSRVGVQVGDRFEVMRATEPVIDPDTGRVLGARKTQLGMATVIEVQGGFAVARFEAYGEAIARPGDHVGLLARAASASAIAG